MEFRKLLKKTSWIYIILLIVRTIKPKPSIFKRWLLMIDFFKDKRKYLKLTQNPEAKISAEILKPSIFDKTDSTPLDPIYFYQDSWCAEKVFKNKPKQHYDIGSKVEMLGIISRVIPVTMVDIRPLPFKIDNLNFIKGDITNLPFKDGELKSLSSICVIEHIGLGRYGDTIDTYGTEKATEELKRVLADGGNLYISVPVDSSNKVYFNSHRAFSRNYVLKLFSPLELVEEKYIYRNDFVDEYDANRGFGTGLFYFKK